MEERITSRRNPLLAHTKKLLTSRSYREKMGEFAADPLVSGPDDCDRGGWNRIM